MGPSSGRLPLVNTRCKNPLEVAQWGTAAISESQRTASTSLIHRRKKVCVSTYYSTDVCTGHTQRSMGIFSWISRSTSHLFSTTVLKHPVRGQAKQSPLPNPHSAPLPAPCRGDMTPSVCPLSTHPRAVILPSTLLSSSHQPPFAMTEALNPHAYLHMGFTGEKHCSSKIKPICCGAAVPNLWATAPLASLHLQNHLHYKS